MMLDLFAIAAALLAAIVALWGWNSARLEARYWEGRYHHIQGLFSDYRRNSHRRDPRTGRLMPLGD